MVNKNVFRALPRTDKKYLVYQDSPAITEVYWPHLELVYSLLLKYQTANVKIRGFDKQYCRKLITNSSAPDAAEREVVAKLLALYISAHKSELQDVMLKFSYILTSYCQRETVPFAVQGILDFFLAYYTKLDKQFLVRFLPDYVIPLISSQHFFSFMRQVKKIFELYMSLDQSWCMLIVDQILKRWPESSATKEGTFVALLTSVVENMNLTTFTTLAVPVFTQFTKCTCSDCLRVITLSSAVWTDVKVIPMVMDNTGLVFPIVVPKLLKMMKEHWNKEVQAMILKTLKTIRDLDSAKFDEMNGKSSKARNKPVQPEGPKTLTKWATVARAAAARDRTIDLAGQLATIHQVFADE